MGTGGRDQLEIANLGLGEQFQWNAPSTTSLFEKLRRLWSSDDPKPHAYYLDSLDYVGWLSAHADLEVGTPVTYPTTGLYRSIRVGFIGEDQHKIVLENERLKTQLIAEQRAVLTARQHQAELSSQHEVVLEGICELVRANKALQAALIAQAAGRICLHETHSGSVTEVLGDQVAVLYETPDGRLRQIYDRAQFVHGKLPEEGDVVEAHVMIAVAKSPDNQKEAEQASDLPNFRDKGSSGTIRI